MTVSMVLALIGMLETVWGLTMIFGAVVGGVAMTDVGSRITSALLISGAILLSVWGHRCTP